MSRHLGQLSTQCNNWASTQLLWAYTPSPNLHNVLALNLHSLYPRKQFSHFVAFRKRRNRVPLAHLGEGNPPNVRQGAGPLIILLHVGIKWRLCSLGRIPAYFMC